MNKAELFQSIRKQAQKVLPVLGGSNHANSKKTDTKVGRVIEGQAQEKQLWDTDYQDLQQLFRHQFPSVTKQLLGQRYSTVNKISRFVLPNGMDQAADELLELLADFASGWASTESVLSATGAKEIQQLSTDVLRSQRAGFALKEANKALAALQGAFSGATGLLGAAVDLPASVIFSLKTIYEIGHSYGFELSDKEDQKAVYFALSQMDLGLIAEKQALFFVLRGLKNMVATGDLSQVQGFLNSNYSVEQFNQYLLNENGQYKWSALNLLSKVKVLRFATPIAGGVVGAFYNVKLIEEVALKADDFFAQARTYFKNNPESELGILDAYHHQQKHLETQAELLLDASPLLVDSVEVVAEEPEAIKQQAVEAIENNDKIVNVVVKDKPVQQEVVDVEKDIQQGIEQLAFDHVTTQVEVDQPIETEIDQNAEALVETTHSEEEDLTKDLVKLVKVYTEKTKKQPEVDAKTTSEDESEGEVLEVEADLTSQEVEKLPVKAQAKAVSPRKTATPRKPSAGRARKKATTPSKPDSKN